MNTGLTANDLIEFEQEIAECYRRKEIKAPIHLRSGCEEQLIEIFKEIQPHDYIYNYWASHLHCLLKGVPREELKAAILRGDSIALCFPEHRIFCSGIVGSLAGVAVGTAMSIKARGGQEHVWLFTGDMGAHTGIFFEAYNYGMLSRLPVYFVIEDNRLSVMTPTEDVWGGEQNHYFVDDFYPEAFYYSYKNGWPHSGINERVSF